MNFNCNNFITPQIVTGVSKEHQGTYSCKVASIQTPYFETDLQIPLNVNVASRTSDDWSEDYESCYNKPSQLSVGDYIYLPRCVDKKVPKTKLNVSSLLTHELIDTCRLQDSHFSTISSKIIKDKTVSEEDTNYVLMKTELNDVEKLTPFLTLMYSNYLESKYLDINQGFLILIKLYLEGNYLITKSNLKLTCDEETKEVLLKYFEDLGYLKLKQLVYSSSQYLIVTSNLFRDLFINGFFNLKFLCSLNVATSVRLIGSLDTKHIVLKDKIQATNLQRFYYANKILVGLNYNTVSKDYSVNLNISDYYISLNSGFLIEITDISFTKHEVLIDFIE